MLASNSSSSAPESCASSFSSSCFFSRRSASSSSCSADARSMASSDSRSERPRPANAPPPLLDSSAPPPPVPLRAGPALSSLSCSWLASAWAWLSWASICLSCELSCSSARPMSSAFLSASSRSLRHCSRSSRPSAPPAASLFASRDLTPSCFSTFSLALVNVSTRSRACRSLPLASSSASAWSCSRSSAFLSLAASARSLFALRGGPEVVDAAAERPEATLAGPSSPPFSSSTARVLMPPPPALALAPPVRERARSSADWRVSFSAVRCLFWSLNRSTVRIAASNLCPPPSPPSPPAPLEPGRRRASARLRWRSTSALASRIASSRLALSPSSSPNRRSLASASARSRSRSTLNFLACCRALTTSSSACSCFFCSCLCMTPSLSFSSIT
mmetsp:Transcript_6448/g.15201  ORF Transcript_6448/g.15201 Transcript_6448/m.15201 type:complete len:390 (-) Transcript_6448:4025-5194(-)